MLFERLHVCTFRSSPFHICLYIMLCFTDSQVIQVVATDLDRTPAYNTISYSLISKQIDFSSHALLWKKSLDMHVFN